MILIYQIVMTIQFSLLFKKKVLIYRSKNSQEVETTRLRVSVKKGAHQKTKIQNTPRDSAAQEQASSKHSRRGQDARDWIHETPWDRKGPGRR